MLNSKGQGLPLSTVVLGILGILVLIILAAVVSSYFLNFGDVATSCTASGGTCFSDEEGACVPVASFGDDDPTGITTDPDPTCPDEEGNCCPAGYKVRSTN